MKIKKKRLSKKAEAIAKSIAFVCKGTGLTEVEVMALVKKGATPKVIIAAGMLKKNGLGFVRV
ncbi:MAG: hypothetical protein WC208_14140 [Gallionella sp.]|jgi:hypothetical protein